MVYLRKSDLVSPSPEFRRETSLKFPASGLLEKAQSDQSSGGICQQRKDQLRI